MKPKHSWLCPVLAAAIVLPSACGTTLFAEPAASYAPEKAAAFMAINDPDRFAWELFCAINAPAANEHPRDQCHFLKGELPSEFLF